MSEKIIKASWFGDGIMMSIIAPPTTTSITLTPEEAQQLIGDLTRLFVAPDVSEPAVNVIRIPLKLPE